MTKMRAAIFAEAGRTVLDPRPPDVGQRDGVRKPAITP
jgi:hypothetical protein